MRASICEEYGCFGIWQRTSVPYMVYTDNGYDTTLIGPCNEFSDPNARFVMSRGDKHRWAAGPQVSNNSFDTLPVSSGQSMARCIDYARRLPWGVAEPATQPQPQPQPQYSTVSNRTFMQIDWRLIAAAVLVLIATTYGLTRK